MPEIRSLLCLSVAWLMASCAPPAPAPATGDPEAELARFDEWVERFRHTPGPQGAALVEEGVALAAARKEALVALAAADPRAAAARRLPFHLYRDLPQAVVAQIERPLDAVGAYEVVVHEGAGGSRIERTLHVEGARYRVATWGRRLRTQTRDRLAVHGYVVGDLAVLTDSPVRTLMAGELPPGGRKIGGAARCGGGGEERLLDLGEKVLRVCSRAEALAIESEWREAEWSTGPAADPRVAWTHGYKRILYMRIDFSDDPGAPVEEEVARLALEEAGAYYEANSYGRLSLAGEVTPVLRMPLPLADYADANNRAGLIEDARAAAAQAGYDPADYDLDIVAYAGPFGNNGGLATLGGRGLTLNGSFGASVLIHEIGHNLGASHAGALRTGDGSVIGPGEVETYGNPFDVMGNAGRRGSFSAFTRYHLGWLPPAAIADGSAGGSFELADLDADPAASKGFHAIRIRRNPVEDLWLEYRPGDTFAADGVLVYLTTEGVTAGMVHQPFTLLDMEPSAPGSFLASFYDAPLLVGRTFSDPGFPIHITPFAGGDPASMPVEIRVAPPAGSPPTLALVASTTEVAVDGMITFTANASDPDGDPLHYAWEVGIDALAHDEPILERTFRTDGLFIVRCTVSDGSGGVASDTLVVEVGDGSHTFSPIFSGIVSRNGQPVQGVLVSSNSGSGRSNAAGRYHLRGSGLLAHDLFAVFPGHSVVPGNFENPVAATDRYDLDFEVEPTSHRLAGTVLRSDGSPAPGALVMAGGQEAFTDASGRFFLWPVSPGVHEVRARSLWGRRFGPVNFDDPLLVDRDRDDLRFEEITFRLSGTIHGAAAPVDVTDGDARTTSYLGDDGAWHFALDVSGGLSNLWIESAGRAFVATFEQPLDVEADRDGLDFSAADEGMSVLQGRVLDRGAPVVGALVRAGDREALSDAGGWWILGGVPRGSWELVPARWEEDAFVPASRTVVAAGGFVGGLDFELARLQPPFFVLPPTLGQNPVATTEVDVAVLADDDGGEAALRYRWTATGPAPVAFSRDDSNAAREVVATFGTAGAYRLEVIAEDEDGLQARQWVDVEVLASPAILELLPASAVLAPGQALRFASLVRDPFGAALDPQPLASWSGSSEGTVDADGTFVAEAPGRYEVLAVAAGIEGRATVRVNGPPEIRSVEAAAEALVGTPWKAAADAVDDAAGVRFTWTSHGDAPVYFTNNGTALARTTEGLFVEPGAYEVEVVATDVDGAEASRRIAVRVLPAPPEEGQGGGAAAASSGCGCGTAGGADMLAMLLALGASASGARLRSRVPTGEGQKERRG